MEITLTQQIYYTNREHLSLSEIATSLLSLEKASRLAPVAMEKLFDGVVVTGLDVSLEELHSGSLLERVRYFLRFSIQRHIEDETGTELGTLDNVPSVRREQILGWLISACILVALKYASDQFFQSSEKPNLEQQINITMQAGGDITGIDSDILRRKIEEAVKDNPEAVKGALGFIKPVKRDSDASIQLDNKSYLQPQTLAEIPITLPDVEPQEKALELQQVEIRIRATDRDSGRKGWGATIPDFSDKRIRLSIAPGIDLNYLAHHDVVIGMVSVFYTVDAMGNITKPHAHLFAVDKERTKALPNGGRTM